MFRYYYGHDTDPNWRSCLRVLFQTGNNCLSPVGDAFKLTGNAGITLKMKTAGATITGGDDGINAKYWHGG